MVTKLLQFCKLVELRQKGSAPAAWAASLFQCPSMEKVGTRLFSELFVVSKVGQKPNTANAQTVAQLLRP